MEIQIQILIHILWKEVEEQYFGQKNVFINPHQNTRNALFWKAYFESQVKRICLPHWIRNKLTPTPNFGHPLDILNMISAFLYDVADINSVLRSREARRLKENQIAMRAAYLEKQANCHYRHIHAVSINISNFSTFIPHPTQRYLIQPNPSIHLSIHL